MSKKEAIIDELDKIKQVVEQFHNGISLQQIRIKIALPIESKTLERRLAKLENDGLVRKEGKTKGLLYFPVPASEAPKGIHQKGWVDSVIPLSEAGKSILELMNKPIQQRKPVGYDEAFLDQYQPNKTFYLSKEQLKRLETEGITARLNQPAGTYAKDVLHRLLIDLSWNSSRLEGNTYSLLDTEKLISQGQSAENKSAAEAQMILNHKDAIEFIVQYAEEIGFNRYTLLNLHALLSNNLLGDPSASGRLRTMPVGIMQSVYTPLSIPQKIEELFERLLEKADAIENAFEQAFFIMVHLPYLQAFDDVNKRVSRLAANISFNKHNLVPLSFIDLPEELYFKGLLAVYELNRVELLRDVFIWAYERSAAKYSVVRQSLGEPDPFRLKYRDAIKEVITEIVSEAAGKNLIYQLISTKTGKLPLKDRAQFQEAVITELKSLHEGNIARYWIRPDEFKKWKAVQQSL